MINSKKILDYIMAAVIFIAAAIELISWFLSFGEEATIVNKGNGYLLYWYPLLNTLTVWVFALFFLIKVIRYKACIYSELVAGIYFLVQSINMLALVFSFGYEVYNIYIYPIFLFSILALSTIKLIRWLLKLQQHQYIKW